MAKPFPEAKQLLDFAPILTAALELAFLFERDPLQSGARQKRRVFEVE